jgi:hypothetical protein
MGAVRLLVCSAGRVEVRLAKETAEVVRDGNQPDGQGRKSIRDSLVWVLEACSALNEWESAVLYH